MIQQKNKRKKNMKPNLQPENLIGVHAIINRIMFLMLKTGMSKAELGRRIGVTRSAIAKMLKEKPISFDIEKITKLSHAFSCDPIWLQYGENNTDNLRNILQKNQTSAISESVEIKSNVSKILTGKPLLLWQEADNWEEATRRAMQLKNRIILPLREDLHKDCFHLKIEKDSMFPRFQIGNYIIVNPHEKPRYGSFTIVKLLDENENVFVQYFSQEREIRLGFTNLSYPPIIKSPDKIKVVGVVIEKLSSEIIT